MGNMLNRCKEIGSKIRETLSQRFEQGTVFPMVTCVEVVHGIFDRTLQQHCGAIVQRVSTRSLRFYPGNFDWKRSKEGAREAQWIHRGPQVVTIAWERDLGC